MASLLSKKGDEPLDCVVRLVTPERIIVVHPLAGPFRRFAAYLIDLGVLVMLVLVVILVSIVLAVFSAGSPAVVGPMLVAFFVLSWGYGAFCEGVFNGRTLGKLCLGIRVVSDRGVPISGAQAVLRNLVGAVDGPFPFFFQVGLASMTLSPRFQRLGDLAAGTMVVREERRSQRGFVRIKEPEVDAILPWLPSRIAARSPTWRVRFPTTPCCEGGSGRSAGPSWPSRWQGSCGRRFRLSPQAPGRCRLVRGLSSSFHRRVNAASAACFLPFSCSATQPRSEFRIDESCRAAGAARISLARARPLLVHLADRRKLSAAEVLRLGELYRSACTDLMLADDHDLPRETVAHLQALVARATTWFTAPPASSFATWAAPCSTRPPAACATTPLFGWPRVVFWGVFLFSALLSAGRSDFAPQIVGEPFLEQLRPHVRSSRVNATRARRPGAQRHGDGRLLYSAQHVDRPSVFRLGNPPRPGKPLPAFLERACLRDALRLHGHPAARGQFL